MPTLALVVVPAYYLDPASGATVEALLQNRVLAADFADKWNAWRDDVKATFGWELLISPPNDPNDWRAAEGYTKAMYRTPEDEGMMYAYNPAEATPMDTGAHQAGRAVDIDLKGMQQLYGDFDYKQLAALAATHGIYNRLAQAATPEAWHFDDNPAAIFGSSAAAIEAIGNLSSQVAQDPEGGRPEDLALAAYNSKNLLLMAGILGSLYVLWYTVEKKKTASYNTPRLTAGDEVRATL